MRALEWPEAWEALAEVRAWYAFNVENHVIECDCTSGPCDAEPRNEVGGYMWKRCPNEAMRHPYFATACHLADAQQTQPLADWPAGYSLGMTEAIGHIQHQRAKKAFEDMKRAQRGD